MIASLIEGWESFDGMLALKGVDPSGWTMRRLINAAEYQYLSSAEDDKDAAKLRAKLYAPPKGLKTSGAPGRRKPRKAPPVPAQTTAQMLALAALQDAQG